MKKLISFKWLTKNLFQIRSMNLKTLFMTWNWNELFCLTLCLWLSWFQNFLLHVLILLKVRNVNIRVSPRIICLFVSILRINIIFLKNICKNLILILRPILLRALVSLSLSPSRNMGLTKISLVESLLF